MSTRNKRSLLCYALVAATLPAWFTAAQDAPTDKSLKYYLGKVVPLAGLLAKQGAKLDADAEPFWLALQTENGNLLPLIKDDGSRMFFNDAKLLNRPMRLTAKQIAGSQLLQVVNVHSIVKGKLHDIYYWCDICTIKCFEAGPCGCCGAPVEFREVPVK